jgi:hypothetical protein
VKLKNMVGTRLSDEEYTFLRQLAEREERRPADVLRRLVIAAKKQSAPDPQDRGAFSLSTVS